MRSFPGLSISLPLVASALLVSAAGPAAAATGWTTELPAATPGLYETVVSLRAPASGPAERIRLAAERSRTQVVTLRPDPRRPRVRVRLRAWVRDGGLSVRVSGSSRRPSVTRWSPRVQQSVLVKPQRPVSGKVPAPRPTPAPIPVSAPATPAETPLAQPAETPAATPDPPAEDPTPPTAPAALPLPDRLVWADEFDGTAGTSPNSRNWNLREGGNGWGNNELQSFTARPQNVSLDGQGNLAITALKESYTGKDGIRRDYTSSRIDTKGKFSFAYGRLEARIRIPAGRGLWPAFWAMGDDVWTAGWPNCGEMDVMETLGQEPSVVHGTLHGPVGFTQTSWAQGRSFTAPESLADGFHTYRVVWTPDTVEWALDGVVFSRIDKSQLAAGARWAFDHDFHILLNLSVGGNWPGSPDAATPFPSKLLVDWVRVYQ